MLICPGSVIRQVRPSSPQILAHHCRCPPGHATSFSDAVHPPAVSQVGTVAAVAPVTVMADPNPRSTPIPVDAKGRASD
jgi:hypothetical protein